MTTDELIAWVGEQAARALTLDCTRAGNEAGIDAEYAAMLTSVENALRRLAAIERDHGGEG